MGVEIKYKEKLAILSELIAFAKVDGLVPAEYDFLSDIAEDLGIVKEVFDSLFDNPVKQAVSKSESQKITHFQNLVRLMNVDNKQTLPEINKLHKLGLRLGLSANAIQQVLSVMHHYPNKDVPKDVIEDAFKSSYN